MQIWLRRIVAAESEAAVFKSQTTRVDRTTFFMIAETEVQGPQTEFESQFCVNKYFVKTRRLGSGLPCVGNAVDQKICQRLPCPMTGLSGILGGTDGTVRVGIMGAGRLVPPARPGGGGGPRPGAVGA
jgi:hypothetical protein